MEKNKELHPPKSIVEFLNIPASKIQRETFFGLVMCVILDKEAFKRNDDLKPFVIKVFNLDFKKYVYDSRSILSSRLVKQLYIKNSDELHNLKVEFFIYFKKKYKIEYKESISKWLK